MGPFSRQHPVVLRFNGPLKYLALPLALLLLLGVGCAMQLHVVEKNPGNFPFFIDDASREELYRGLDIHLQYLRRKPPEDIVQIGAYRLNYRTLADSLAYFRTILEQSSDVIELNRNIREHFHVFQAAGRNGERDVLVTGYYEPLFQGSLTKTGPFTHALYGVPDTLVTRDGSAGKKRVGRLDSSGKLIPFWTRRDIENDQVIGGELVYLDDPLDAYLLHVQGSGRVQLRDGSIRALHFAASNGLRYRSLGKLFVDRGIMKKQDVNIPSIRDYFRKHPEKLTEMLQRNPRFIFFGWGDDQGPRGSLGLPLTRGRSVAIDHDILPHGVVGFLVSMRPVINSNGSIDHWRPFSRFVLPQDSGAAIKGTGRVDIFWGNGQYAETAASHMNEAGQLYFLLRKNFELPDKIR